MKIELLNEVENTMIFKIGLFDTRHIEREIVAHFLNNGGYNYSYTTKEGYILKIWAEEKNYQTNEFFIRILDCYF